MEIIRGESELLLTIRRKEDGVVILRALSADKTAVLPEEIFGLPVTELEHHAFAPNRPDTGGEVVRIACGPAPAEAPDNSRLTDVTLPASLTVVKKNAFGECKKLIEVRYQGDEASWGKIKFDDTGNGYVLQANRFYRGQDEEVFFTKNL